MQSYLQYRRIHQAVKHHYDGSSQEDGDREDCKGNLPAAEPSICVVQWDEYDAHLNPRQYSPWRKAAMTALVSLIGLSCTAASAIDSAGVPQYSEYWGVSPVVGSLTTALFMIGFGLGSFISGPFSETFGRNIVYMVTMAVFLIFIMAAGLAPNLPSHLIFRFLAGLFAATPLTCVGGTVADLWDPLQKTYGFIIYTIPAFNGPMIGQVIGSYLPTTLGWRWLEWIMLIFGGLMFTIMVFFQQETHQDLLLTWKAAAVRKYSGQPHWRGPIEVRQVSLAQRLKIALSRPFAWILTEPIIILTSLYLIAIYIILFLFLEGYRFIFEQTYHFSQGLNNITWIAMFIGSAMITIQVPFIWRITKNQQKNLGRIRPETRLWYAMLGGAPAIPISLFWMAWTSYPHISVWSPIIASAMFGFGITTVFVSAHLYVIDAYEQEAASAFAMVVMPRYLASGGITVAGGPIYTSLGVHYILTILGAISAVMAFIPYLFYFTTAKMLALTFNPEIIYFGGGDSRLAYPPTRDSSSR
ncbi:MFS general substrate transporter [Aspergillus sclerotiicarbonarius CBS 121057]|uniref:MFS general substrate transporter n=1 Tax=Aspergillus sclerotiicarbonarius (strain CBS 121057 / IBT 28362) TaxID=1448318 RepID=A0A319DTW1_ASPSB|nr:MFS general substrate transporter [Aspergillus sclerotiicarbonarius CBS 121057]